MTQFLIQAILIIGLPFVLWRWQCVRQVFPLAVIQISVGVLLGPSGLGMIWPDALHFVFPSTSLPALDGLAWLGVVMFAFSTGLHCDLLDKRSHGTCSLALVSLVSVAIPMLAGIGLVLVLPPGITGTIPPNALAAGVAIALGVTALPVLGAIVRDMQLQDHPIGHMALACAAVSDAVLWLGLAALLATQGQSGLPWWLSGLGGILFAAVLWGWVRPALRRYDDRVAHGADILSQDHLSELLLLSIGVLVSAAIGEALGLHGVLGAFMFGTIIPKPLAKRLVGPQGGFDAVLIALLLPFFFVTSGLKCQPFAMAESAFLLLAVVALAMGSKMMAALLPKILWGWTWRDCGTLGALTSCKGMMELVVLTVLLENKLMSQDLYSVLLMMALICTAAAKPVAQWFLAPSLSLETSKTQD